MNSEVLKSRRNYGFYNKQLYEYYLKDILNFYMGFVRVDLCELIGKLGHALINKSAHLHLIKKKMFSKLRNVRRCFR